MIFLFTDYGLEGPYIGQVETVLYQLAPQVKIINLIADAPHNNPKASAYLLASLIHKIPPGSILFCVVDPGVGSNKDKPVMLKIDERWFVGPDNGLFDIVTKRSKELESWEISWTPENLSNSFHGRDLYAPVCAMLENKEQIPGDRVGWIDKHQWSENLNEIIYIDHFGNCMTGINAQNVSKKSILKVNNQEIAIADTFSDVSVGRIFWYENSNGLIEIAVNQESASKVFGLIIGSAVMIFRY
jgi:S-adenosyl-L-methionine hydrolase (adenosine-forming)